jgi:hypothetical protein
MNVTTYKTLYMIFNSVHRNLQYTIETQKNNKLNFLDVTIENTNNTFTFNIYIENPLLQIWNPRVEAG